MEALTSPLYVDTRSLYAQFIEEVHGLSILEKSYGYATYELGPDYVYVIDVFIVPSERALKKGSQLFDEIELLAKEQGKVKIFSSVAIETREPLKPYNMLRHMGFQDSHQDAGLIYLVKEIQ